VATAREFVEFWLLKSAHPDEQFSVRRGRAAIRQLADNLIRAAEGEGFTRTQIEVELGGSIYSHIRQSIAQQNPAEGLRLGKSG
jgi:hypothetical protein